MTNSIVNQVLFRICSPIIMGLVAYLILLLFNNQLEQLQEEFLNIELVIFIMISFIIQESSRIIITRLIYKRVDSFLFRQFIPPLIFCLIAAMIVTSVILFFYFKTRLGYAPEYDELIQFNIIFTLVSLVYFSLYLSFFLLEKDYSNSMKSELLKKQEIEADFIQYKNGINPELLFECIESLIMLVHQDAELADELLNNMSHVYRYILSPKYEEIISLEEEWTYANKLIVLFESLPYRKVNVLRKVKDEVHIVKGTLLTIIESIIKSSIRSRHQELTITMSSDEHYLVLKYTAAKTLHGNIMTDRIKTLNGSYEIYSDLKIEISNEGHQHQIKIPILQLNNQSI